MNTVRDYLRSAGLVVLFVVLCFTTVFAEDIVEDDDEQVALPAARREFKPIPPIPPNIKKYLEEKYGELNHVTAELQQTPDGPKGYIYWSGQGFGFKPRIIDTLPQRTIKTDEDKKARAEAIAKAIVADEVSLLGVTDVGELRTRSYISDIVDNRYIDVYFDYFIGKMQVERWSVQMSFRPDAETVVGVSGHVLPVTSEIYEAAGRRTLSRDKIYEAIKKDLNPGGGDEVSMNVVRKRKVIRAEPPYIVWVVKVEANSYPGGKRDFMGWDYEVDAFTGKVLRKGDGRRQIGG